MNEIYSGNEGPSITERDKPQKLNKGAGPPGFEPGLEAPEAPVLSRLYYEPLF